VGMGPLFVRSHRGRISVCCPFFVMCLSLFCRVGVSDHPVLLQGSWLLCLGRCVIFFWVCVKGSFLCGFFILFVFSVSVTFFFFFFYLMFFSFFFGLFFFFVFVGCFFVSLMFFFHHYYYFYSL